jgi:hypothetical protein
MRPSVLAQECQLFDFFWGELGFFRRHARLSMCWLKGYQPQTQASPKLEIKTVKTLKNSWVLMVPYDEKAHRDGLHKPRHSASSCVNIHKAKPASNWLPIYRFSGLCPRGRRAHACRPCKIRLRTIHQTLGVSINWLYFRALNGTATALADVFEMHPQYTRQL